MHASTMIVLGLVAALWLTPAFAQPSGRAQPSLQGSWMATSAERDGGRADDVVGNRLSFAGQRFQIRSRDGKALYEGTFRSDPGAKPSSIDFDHTGAALKGTAWKGIYSLEGDTLRVCDNAPAPDKPRPTMFEAKAGSGYVCIAFQRAKS